nr:MAG TPA: hypothetical protein [Caudoviricetes sp.]
MWHNKFILKPYRFCETSVFGQSSDFLCHFKIFYKKHLILYK